MLGIFLDTETSGLNALKHRLLEIAFKIVDVYSGEVRAQFHSVIYQTPEQWQKSDKESLKINGFTWEEIEKGEKPDLVASKILELLAAHSIKRGEAVFICQNPSFDRAFFSQLIDPDLQEKLLWPYHWLDLASMYWARSMEKGKSNPELFPWKTGVSKDKIAAASSLPGEGKPHRAMKGVEHLLLCYQTVVGFPGRS
ncbi:MAG: 3'-5' exonuclease [Chlamydiales bacterium]|nr:3'-5' exonuclease [Chlamydiales bacterium]